MRITKSQLRKIISENLMVEQLASTTVLSNTAQAGTGAPKNLPSEKVLSRVYTDSSDYKFRVQSDEKIFYLGRGNQRLVNPKEIVDDQKVKVAKNLIRDQKAAKKRVSSTSVLNRIANPASAKRADSEPVGEGIEVITDAGGYVFHLYADGKLIVASKDGRDINKELKGSAREKSIKNLARDIGAAKIKDYPLLNTTRKNLKKQDEEGKRDDIKYFEGYDLQILDTPGVPNKAIDMVVGKCRQDHCAQFLSDTLGRDIAVGNAWHSHSRVKKGNTSGFTGLSKTQQERAAKLFSEINKKPVAGSKEEEVRKFVLSLVPQRGNFTQIKLGDLVGLTFFESSNWTKAFFEGATGNASGNLLGDGGKRGSGPYFVKAGDDGKEVPWSKSDLGSDIDFKPGKTLKGGGGFGMNTHIGMVGALHDGAPIIYHNVHRNVRATGLNAMKKGGLMVAWTSAPPKKKA